LQTDPNTAFLRAARAGQQDKVVEYLDSGVDINTANAVSQRQAALFIVSDLLEDLSEREYKKTEVFLVPFTLNPNVKLRRRTKSHELTKQEDAVLFSTEDLSEREYKKTEVFLVPFTLNQNVKLRRRRNSTNLRNRKMQCFS
jgi:hypothetical protein